MARWTKGLSVVLVAAIATASVSAAQEPDWCGSPYGADDEIGAANRLSPDGVIKAARLVTAGKTYALGIETNQATPAYPPRTFEVTVVQPGQAGGAALGPTATTYNDDIITGWVGVGSQIDGLGHIGIDNVYYNCHRAAEFAGVDGLTKLGIEKIPPIVTRGVVLDMTAVFAADPVPAGTPINQAEIEAAMKLQGISIGQGDVVLLHTGWLKVADEDPAGFIAAEPGLGREGARYLAALGVVAVGADQSAIEVIPFEEGAGVFEVHQILLAQNGIYTLENIQTAELVADKAWEFLFVLGQAKITGAVQGIINPVAIR